MGKNVLVSMAGACSPFRIREPAKNKNEEFSNKKCVSQKIETKVTKFTVPFLWYPVRRSCSSNLMHFSFLVISASISCTILCGSQKSFRTIIKGKSDAIDFNRLDFFANAEKFKRRQDANENVSSNKLHRRSHSAIVRFMEN